MELPVDLAELKAVLESHGVHFALVFGSHAHGRAKPDSDVDLAVFGGEDLDAWALRGDLPDIVDLVDLASSPDGLVGRVAMEGVVVLDADPVARIRWQATTRKRHLDESFRRERFRKDFVASHSGKDQDRATHDG